MCFLMASCFAKEPPQLCRGSRTVLVSESGPNSARGSFPELFKRFSWKPGQPAWLHPSSPWNRITPAQSRFLLSGSPSATSRTLARHIHPLSPPTPGGAAKKNLLQLPLPPVPAKPAKGRLPQGAGGSGHHLRGWTLGSTPAPPAGRGWGFWAGVFRLCAPSSSPSFLLPSPPPPSSSSLLLAHPHSLSPTLTICLEDRPPALLLTIVTAAQPTPPDPLPPTDLPSS